MSLDRYIALILRHRWRVVALAVLAMLVLASGGRFLKVTNDYRATFAEDNPQLMAFDELEDTYAQSNVALIAVAPRDGTVFTREALDVVAQLTEAAWQVPYSARVDSLTNYSHSEAHGDDLTVAELVRDAPALTEAGLERVRTIAMSAPDIARRLISDDGRIAGLVINFTLPDDPEIAWGEVKASLDDMLAQARADHPEVDFYLTGDIIMYDAFAKASKASFEQLVPIVLLLLLGATAVLLRSLLGTAIMALLIILCTGTTLGIAGWFGVTLSSTNVVLPIIVMTFVVAYSIHITTATLKGLGRGLGRDEAVAAALRKNAYPVFLTTVTTMIGFLSLNSSESPPFQLLGNLVAVGVVCTFLYAMTFLPAMLSILPLHARRVETEHGGFFDRFGEFVVTHRALLLLFIAAAMAVLAFGLPRNKLGDDWIKYFDESYEFRRHTDFVIENLTSLDRLEYSLRAPCKGCITEVDYLRTVEAFAQWYRAQPEVTYVQTFTDIMKRLNKNMNGDDPAFYRLPDDPQLAAQYLLLYELSLPFGSDLNDRIDISKSATRMTVALHGMTAWELRQVGQRAQDWLRANAPELLTEETGLSVVFAHLSKNNIDGMLRGTFIAMCIISFILIWVFRSLRLGLMSLVPNFLPSIMAFGAWGFFVGQVNLSASVVTAIAFGIVVDDTIHFMTKYQKARRDGLPSPDAVRSTFREVGRPLWSTTAILAAGFMVFGLSGFTNNWVFGLLITITIGFALIADFLLLPILLMLADRDKSQKTPAAANA